MLGAKPNREILENKIRKVFQHKTKKEEICQV